MSEGDFDPKAAYSLNVHTDCHLLSVVYNIQQQPRHKEKVK